MQMIGDHLYGYSGNGEGAGAESTPFEDEGVERKPEKKRLRIVPTRLVRRHVAVVDDDEAIQLYLRETLGQRGYSVWCFGSAEEFLEDLRVEGKIATTEDPFQCPFDVIVCDVRLPGQDGLSLVQILRTLAPDVPIVLMTAYAQVESAVRAIKEGAYDYLEKPFQLERLTLVLENALKVRALHVENEFLKASGAVGLKLSGVVSQSPAMVAIFELVKRVAPSESSVFITGERGVGKKMIATAIHENGDRANKPFIKLNCSAISDSLIESELFGHTKGSFSGASEHRKGLFEEADGGTLFLDEVGDLPLSIQGKLLSALREGRVRAVGEESYRKVDVRIISTSSKSISVEIRAGRFREDLFYALNIIPLHIPPLRQRKEDILALARSFLVGKKTFSAEALSTLVQIPWKGNITELKSFVERSVLMTTGDLIDQSDLPVAESHELEDFIADFSEEFPSLKDVEKNYLLSVLRRLNGKKDAAAKVLGLSRRTLYRKLNKTEPDKPLL